MNRDEFKEVYRDHFAIVTDRDGAQRLIAPHGETLQSSKAMRFKSSVSAHKAAQSAIGFDQYAFWNSERERNRRLQSERRGWKGAVQPCLTAPI